MSLILAALVGVIMVVIDQLSKTWVISYFSTGRESLNIINGIISFCHTENDGAGFSIFSGKTIFLVIFTVLAMAAIVFIMVKGYYKSRITNWGFCLILSGGIGNLIDRVLRGGLVVDFIRTDFMDFPIFNVADICVTVGAGLIILYFILDIVSSSREKGSKNNEADNS